MASFTDTTKHVARQAKARQPKLHLDTGAEALRALGFQLGENIKMATGWVSGSLHPNLHTELESTGGSHQTPASLTLVYGNTVPCRIHPFVSLSLPPPHLGAGTVADVRNPSLPSARTRTPGVWRVRRARARILGAVIPDHQADYKEHARLWVEKVEKRGAPPRFCVVVCIQRSHTTANLRALPRVGKRALGSNPAL